MSTDAEYGKLLLDALNRIEELESRLAARAQPAARTQREPAAIIGAACRFPGQIDSLDACWNFLAAGRDAIGPFPQDRHALGLAPWRAAERRGGYLGDPSLFDAEFFNLSPREANLLDPQQRLLLETVWEALESAGVAPASLFGSRTGVYVGICGNDYQHRLLSLPREDIDAYFSTGTAHSTASGRISYFFGFEGPSMSIDTACSSSLTAIHLALQGLRNGDCDVAIVAGVNQILGFEFFESFDKAGMLSPDARCQAFSDAANGFVRAEGCGVVVLKRLADALAADDPALAVISGSAVNQDGRSSGLTAPKGPAQAAVIRQALADAGKTPADVVYVEAHGTGTALGDPIEAGALADVFRDSHSTQRPLLIGTLKASVGHMEAAAGIGGVIKGALMLRHRTIPPHLHFRAPSAHIDWSDIPVRVAHDAQPLPPAQGRGAIGVSSFGFSGTNAHVIVAEGPARQMQRPGADDDGAQLLALSCRSEEALRAQLERYRAHLAGTAEAALDISFTALTGRTAFEHRFAAAGTRQDWLAALDRRLAAPAGGQAGNRPALAFLYSGQGSQYPGMGHGLYARSKTFRDAIDACAGILTPLLGVALDALLWGERRDLLEQTRYTQPALFALEYALGQLWRAAGIEPDVVMGHSLGEFVAACHAGVFSLEDGLRLVSERGRLMAALQTDGAMAVVFAGREQVERVLRGREARLAIGADNGPGNVVLSGDARALDEACRELAAGGIDSRRLAVSQGFHSPLMEPMLDAFRRVAQDVRYGQARIKLISNVSGSVAGPEIGSAQYWVEHVRREVRFGAGVRCARAEGVGAFVEIGPAATLLGMVGDEECERIASLKRGGDDWTQWLAGVGRLFELGYAPRWDALFEARAPRRVALPTYPFQRRRYWHAGPVGETDNHVRPRPDAAGFLYRLDWRADDLPQPAAPPGPWLVVSDDLPAAERMRDELSGRAIRCVALADAHGAERPLAQAVAAALDELGLAAGVIWLGTARAGAAALQPGMVARCTQLQVLKACAGRYARLAVVTFDAAADASGLALAAAAKGMAKTLKLECPDLRIKLVDVIGAGASLRAVADEALCGDAAFDGFVRLDGRRQVARLLPCTAPVPAHSPVGGGVYVVTGGLGGVGQIITEWLLDNGAGHVAVLQRHAVELPARFSHAQAQRIGVHACDVSDGEQLARALDAVRRIGPIRGVFHAAGAVGGTAPIEALAPADFDAVFTAKVGGAAHLHRLTRDDALDAFVLISSGASVWGAQNRAHYVVANQFLDDLAASRLRAGLRAASLNLGFIDGGGMTRAGDRRRYLEDTGLIALDDSQVKAGLDRAMATTEAQLVVAGFDWQRFLALYRLRPHFDLFDALGSGAPAALPPASAPARSAVDLLRLPPASRFNAAFAEIRQVVADVLRFDPRHASFAGKSFQELGIDSITAVEIARRLEARFGLALPATVALESADMAAAANFVLARLQPAVAARPAATAGVPGPADIMSMSDDEIASLLDAELAGARFLND